MKPFEERLSIALRMGEIFFNFMNSVRKEAYVLEGADSLEQLITEIGGKQHLAENIMVFEKNASWIEQGIWFSSIGFAETMRIRFLTHGIELIEDPDTTCGQFFILKDPTKETE